MRPVRVRVEESCNRSRIQGCHLDSHKPVVIIICIATFHSNARHHRFSVKRENNGRSAIALIARRQNKGKLTAENFGQAVTNRVGHLLRLFLGERRRDHDLETRCRLKDFLATQACGSTDENTLTERVVDYILQQTLLLLDRLRGREHVDVDQCGLVVRGNVNGNALEFRQPLSECTDVFCQLTENLGRSLHNVDGSRCCSRQ